MVFKVHCIFQGEAGAQGERGSIGEKGLQVLSFDRDIQVETLACLNVAI